MRDLGASGLLIRTELLLRTPNAVYDWTVVTACHNLPAMEFAGLQGSKFYAGSWSEWIVNKNRSIAKG